MEDPDKLDRDERRTYNLTTVASAKCEALRTHLAARKHEERVAARAKEARTSYHSRGMKHLADFVARAQETLLDNVFEDPIIPAVPTTPITISDSTPTPAAAAPCVIPDMANAAPGPSSVPAMDRDINMQGSEPVATQ